MTHIFKLSFYFRHLKSNSTFTNVVKASEIVEQNAKVQSKLIGSLHDISAEGK